MKKIQTILIEDNRLLREGITVLLNKEKDINVIAAFGDKDFTVNRIGELNPDIVLMDFGLTYKNSFQILKSIKTKFPSIKVIVMDFIPVHDDVLQFVKAGASGFTLKDSGVKEFLSTIRLIHTGEKILPSKLVDTLFNQIILEQANGPQKSSLSKSVRLTKRERQVITLVADGMTNKEIGRTLHLSPFTVKSHVHNILEKLAIHNRIEIAKFAHTDPDFVRVESSTPQNTDELINPNG